MATSNTQTRDALHPLAKYFIEKGGGMDTFNLKEVEALNFLVIKLLDANLWNKCKAIYPFVGRSAACHALNLRNPNRHNIRWYGSVTHNENGATGGGGYGNTLFALGLLTTNDIHLSVYSATNWNDADYSSNLMGASAPTVQKLTLKGATSRYTYSCGDGYFEAGFLVNDARHIEAYGLIMGVDSQVCYVNGRQYGITGVNPTTFVPNGTTNQIDAKNNAVIDSLDQYPVMLFTHDNFGGVSTESLTNIRFASIGNGMTSSEVATFYSIVEGFQSILGRAVGSIVLASTYYETPIEYVSASVSIQSVLARQGLYNITYAEPEMVSASASVLGITVYGARRYVINENISADVSIISFTEA